MTRRLLGILVMASSVSFAALGCGSSGGSTATASDGLTACNAYCDAYITKACADPTYSSAAECKTSECGQLSKAPSSCQGAIKIYYDCEKAQANLCDDTGCSTQFAALASCM